MSRFLSPEKAARRAERAARQAEQRRREKGRMWLMIVGLALVSIALVIADFFWLRNREKQRHEQRHHYSERTNSSTSIPMDDPQGRTTNHE